MFLIALFDIFFNKYIDTTSSAAIIIIIAAIALFGISISESYKVLINKSSMQ